MTRDPVLNTSVALGAPNLTKFLILLSEEVEGLL